MENDHRDHGQSQNLFFFHELSPGSAFFEPCGTKIYNNLVNFIKKEYTCRGYSEVMTPNIFNVRLWKISDHWQHYKKNMYSLKDNKKDEESEMEEYALKPMNCPGHCLIFGHTARSYRELPLRLADFGVLHRNEISGALTGLTRVRRFQQDDAHIFCTKDQIRSEIINALSFMKYVYDIFGMTYTLERSTRPQDATGIDTEEGLALWNLAENELGLALDEFQGKGQWKDNLGDGAFYGPKIDIKVYDSKQKMHQCATIQLDFQLPRKFGLGYLSKEGSIEFPIMIHRAMLGSVERMIAILLEHYKGNWPFWLSPRQVAIIGMYKKDIPTNEKIFDYMTSLNLQFLKNDISSEIPEITSANNNHKELIKKSMKFKFIICIGSRELETLTASVSSAISDKFINYGTYDVNKLLTWFKLLCDNHSTDQNIIDNFIKV